MGLTPEQRFWAKVEKTECWLWTGNDNGHGYGIFWSGERQVYVHRYSYELHKGPIPKGLEIDHICGNRACVNPDHLRAVTHRENVISGNTIAARVHQTHCIHGHEYTPENTIVRRNGTRNCRTCSRTRWGKQRA